MTEIPDFTDRKTAEAWLETQPQQVSIAVAARAALRAVPALADLVPSESSDWTKDDLILTCVRAILVSGARALYTVPETNDQTERLTDAAYFSSDASSAAAFSSAAASSAAFSSAAASSAAFSAAFSSSAARSASAAAYSSSSSAAYSSSAAASSAAFSSSAARSAADAGLGVDAFTTPLWPDGDAKDHFEAAWQDWKHKLAQNPDWDFWIRWYDGMWSGDPLPWALQTEIALIPDEVWEQGLAAVAEAIRDIEDQFWASRLPQAEEIRVDDQGQDYVEALPVDSTDLLPRIFKQLEMAMTIADQSNACEFNSMCVSYKYLRLTLDTCQDDPNSTEQNLGIAHDILVGRLQRDEIKLDDALRGLLSSIESHGVQLRADHPEVRAAWETRTAQRLRETSKETRLSFAKAIRAWMPSTKGRLTDELELDAQTIETDANLAAQAKAIGRAGGRAAKASLVRRASDKAKEIDASGGYKGARIGWTGWSIVEMLSKLF